MTVKFFRKLQKLHELTLTRFDYRAESLNMLGVRPLCRKYIPICCKFGAFRRQLSSKRTHHERRLLKVDLAHAYNVVSDVKSYPHFVPWCISSTITRPLATITFKSNSVDRSNENGSLEEMKQQEMEAELTVGFKNLFTEKYTSHVTLFPSGTQPKVVAMSSNTHILDYLHTTWEFKAAGSNKNHCWVNFKVDFQFKSSLYNQVSSVFMKEVVEKMVVSFEKRMLETAKK